MLPEGRRRKLAAFFTPPAIVHHTIRAALEAGMDLRRHRVIDPSAGGAAFLSTLAGLMRDAGVERTTIQTRIRGIELEPGLARLSRFLISDRLGALAPASVVAIGDALRLAQTRLGRFDVVLANPPYGRVTGTSSIRLAEGAPYVHRNHINLYVLFAGVSIRLARPGGIVALVIPSSFLVGPFFAPLRRYVRQTCHVLAIDLINKKEGVFVDVDQEICVLTLRRYHSQPERTAPTALSMIDAGGHRICETHLRLPSDVESAWPKPTFDQATALASGCARLSDYGVDVKAGYFVWNRQQTRMATKRRGDRMVPLVWARNVQPGRECLPQARGRRGIDYVRFDAHNMDAIIRSSAVVLQRTTNNSQPRRLIAGVVPSQVVKRFGGYVSENHTIVLIPRSGSVNLRLLSRLLSTRAVDLQFRNIASGSHVSVTALKALPLPHPDTLARLLEKNPDIEVAAQQAYSGLTAE
jgi:adenine-specific DNA-methyltransferase